MRVCALSVLRERAYHNCEKCAGMFSMRMTRWERREEEVWGIIFAWGKWGGGRERGKCFPKEKEKESCWLGERRWKRSKLPMRMCPAKKQYRKFETNFPRKGISTFMCLWAIYIFPRLICLFCCRKIGVQNLEIYKSRTDTWMWKWGLRPRNSQKRNT